MTSTAAAVSNEAAAERVPQRHVTPLLYANITVNKNGGNAKVSTYYRKTMSFCSVFSENIYIFFTLTAVRLSYF